MGDTGGRLGDADSERLREAGEAVEVSLDEAGRVFVSTRSAGMAATLDDGTTATSPGTESAKRRRLPIGGCHEMAAQGRAARRPRGGRLALAHLLMMSGWDGEQ
jgi:hypothetical protein